MTVVTVPISHATRIRRIEHSSEVILDNQGCDESQEAGKQPLYTHVLRENILVHGEPALASGLKIAALIGSRVSVSATFSVFMPLGQARLIF